MKNIYDVIKNNPLFDGICFEDFENMLHCLSAKTAKYKKGSMIFMAGDKIRSVGLILSGNIRIIKQERDGQVLLLNELSACDLFGEVFACAGMSRSPVTAQATGDSEILFIDYNRIISTCVSPCPFHTRLIINMLNVIAQKNLMLNKKITILSKRSTREKLFTFFDFERGDNKKFSIPYNREALAQYLCVDRSAMSNELSKMRNEGLIEFRKNTFEIL